VDRMAWVAKHADVFGDSDRALCAWWYACALALNRCSSSPAVDYPERSHAIFLAALDELVAEPGVVPHMDLGALNSHKRRKRKW